MGGRSPREETSARHARLHAGRRKAGFPRPAWRPEPMVRWFVDRSPERGIPSVSLRRLLPEAQFVGCRDWEVSGCTADSRRLDPGQVYVAVPGTRQDGHSFIGRALERGAAGVVVEHY